MIGILRPVSGRSTVLPIRCLYRGSSGWTATAVSPSIVSGRVVATCRTSPWRAGDRVLDRPELALDVFVVDLVVGDRGAEVGVPVDQPLAAEDLAGLEEAEEGAPDGAGQTSSRVNRVRSQSHEQPISRSWLRIRFSYSSFQAQIRATRASRPRSWRVFFSSSRSRFSTTAWVAIPAWSVPGIQSTSYPCIRRQRIKMSWSVLFSAWPRCSAPVTFGGGMTMQ